MFFFLLYQNAQNDLRSVPVSSWLLFSDRQLQRYFLGLFILHICLGCVRFWFPFQILNLQGNEGLISTASALFAAGQIVGFIILGALIRRVRLRFLLGGLFLLLLMGVMSISQSPMVLMTARIFEGLGYGLFFLGIIALASRFPNHEGEVLGGLFGAIFSGLAIGQGLAGLLGQVLSQWTGYSPSITLQLIAGITVLVTILALLISFPSGEKCEKVTPSVWQWRHGHFVVWIKTFITLPSILFLLLVYALYDFAHGIYTPNLSILLNQQGIDEVSLGFGYLIGDITWGISQLFAGRAVDKTGFTWPLVLSLTFKGVVVFFYPEISFFLILAILLFLAGLSEGFLEPARNKAAISLETSQNYTHSHTHIHFGFSTGGGFTLGAHQHDHAHELHSDSFVAMLQSIGILTFGLGSILGSLLLFQGYPLQAVTVIGGFCLLLASGASVLFSVSKRKSSSSQNLDSEREERIS
ncbi:MAG: MFS transporter [Promethearchaeota archaeon]